MVLPVNVDSHSSAKVSEWDSIPGRCLHLLAVVAVEDGGVAEDALKVPHDLKLIASYPRANVINQCWVAFTRAFCAVRKLISLYIKYLLFTEMQQVSVLHQTSENVALACFMRHFYLVLAISFNICVLQ